MRDITIESVVTMSLRRATRCIQLYIVSDSTQIYMALLWAGRLSRASNLRIKLQEIKRTSLRISGPGNQVLMWPARHNVFAWAGKQLQKKRWPDCFDLFFSSNKVIIVCVVQSGKLACC